MTPVRRNPWYYRLQSFVVLYMTMLPLEQISQSGRDLRLLRRRLWICGLAVVFCLGRAQAQDEPLDKVHVAPPGSTAPADAAGAPAGAEAPAVSGAAALKVHPGAYIRMNVDMVLVHAKPASKSTGIITSG